MQENMFANKEKPQQQNTTKPQIQQPTSVNSSNYSGTTNEQVTPTHHQPTPTPPVVAEKKGMFKGMKTKSSGPEPQQEPKQELEQGIKYKDLYPLTDSQVQQSIGQNVGSIEYDNSQMTNQFQQDTYSQPIEDSPIQQQEQDNNESGKGKSSMWTRFKKNKDEEQPKEQEVEKESFVPREEYESPTKDQQSPVDKGEPAQLSSTIEETQTGQDNQIVSPGQTHQNESYPQVNNEPQEKSKIFSKFKKVKLPEKEQETSESLYRQKYKEITSEMTNFENNLYGKFAKIYIKQSQGEEEKVKLQGKLQELGSLISEKVIQQQRAMESDEYDLADEIQKNIDEMQAQIEETNQEIQSLTSQLASLNEMKQRLRKQELPYYSQLIQKFSEAEDIQRKYMEEYTLEQQESLKKLEVQIQAETERVKISQVHIDIDCKVHFLDFIFKHLDEEEENLISLMNNQTKGYKDELQDLNASRFELETEIQELLRLLKIKQNQLDGIEKRTLEVEGKISVVEQKFSVQLKKVNTKREKFQEEMDQLQREQDQINLLQSDYENKNLAMQNHLSSLAEQLEGMIQKSHALENKSKTLDSDIAYEDDINQKYTLSSKKAYAIYTEIELIERKIVDLGFQRGIIQKQIQEYTDKKVELSVKLPDLVEKKNQLRAAKQFIPAKSVNNEIVETQSQIESLEIKINNGLQSDSDLVNQLEILEQERAQIKQIYGQHAEENELNKYYVLQQRCKDLEHLLMWISETQEKEFLVHQLQISAEERDQLYSKHQEKINPPNQQHVEDEIQQNPEVEQIEVSPEADTQQETEIQTVELTDEQKQEMVKLWIQRIKDSQEKILQLEGQIQEFAENDQFDEAEMAQQMVVKEEAIISQITKDLQTLGISSVEEAEKFVVQLE